MNNDVIINVLINLRQISIGMIAAYDIAAKNIDDTALRSKINEFHCDHENYICELNFLLEHYGVKASKFNLDFKGYLRKGMTALYRINGQEETLRAMEKNETIAKIQYYQAIEENQNLPSEVIMALSRNFDDIKYHISYIRETLSSMSITS